MTSDVPGCLRHAEGQRSTARVVAEMLRYEPAPDGGAAFLLDLPASPLPVRHGTAG